MEAEEAHDAPPPSSAEPSQEMTPVELAEAKRYGRLGLFAAWPTSLSM